MNREKGMKKKCGVCGQTVKHSLLDCPKCGRSVFETEKVHSKPHYTPSQKEFEKQPTGQAATTPCEKTNIPQSRPEGDAEGTRMANRFIDNSDGTITDIQTMLMWQKADDGQKRTFDESSNYCNSLSLGGHRDWRLPTITELLSVSHSWKEIFSKTKDDEPYWSSTILKNSGWEPVAGEKHKYVARVFFSNGDGEVTYFLYYKYYTRAVRRIGDIRNAKSDYDNQRNNREQAKKRNVKCQPKRLREKWWQFWRDKYEPSRNFLQEYIDEAMHCMERGEFEDALIYVEKGRQIDASNKVLIELKENLEKQSLKSQNNTFQRMAQNAMHAELQCNDMTDKASPSGQFALAVLSEPILNRQELLNTQVSPIFRFVKVEHYEFLFIDLDFIDRKRNLVIGAMYSKETTKPFLVAAKTLGCFWFNDKPITADGIQIPVIKPEMLDELLDEIPSS